MPHVYSTTTCDEAFVNYVTAENNTPLETMRVLIKGGSNVASKNLITPLGVHTHVTDDELSFLMGKENFIKQMKAGFIVVRPDEVHPEVAAANMKSRDVGSAPRVPQDFVKDLDGVMPVEGQLKNAVNRISG